MNATAHDFQKHDVASVLDRVGRLRVEARAVIEALMQGMHGSPIRGQSVIFREHAEYVVGDDLRRIDWRATARRPRPVVKKFEHEARLTATLVLDTSTSMHFLGQSEKTKVSFGALLLACLAELLSRQGDRFDLMLIDETEVQHLGVGSGRQQLDRFYAQLVSATEKPNSNKPTTTSSLDLDARLNMLGQAIGRKRGLVVLISDFIPPGNASLEWASALAGLGHAVTAVQLLSRAERKLSWDTAQHFVDPEGGIEAVADPRSAREAYIERLRAWIESLARQARDNGIRWTSASTDALPAQVLLDLVRGASVK